MYVITLRRPDAADQRQRVPNLDEAHRVCGRMVREQSEGSYEEWCAAYPFTLEAADLPASGGVIGPYSGGVTILVEREEVARAA